MFKDVIIEFQIDYGYSRDYCSVIRKARTVKEAESRARKVAEKFANSIEEGKVTINRVDWLERW